MRRHCLFGAALLGSAIRAIQCATVVSIYPYAWDPATSPLYETTTTIPPSRNDFPNLQFATLRGLPQTPNNTIFDINATLAQYASMGSVIWPAYPTIFAPNFDEFLDALVAGNFSLTDLWGYVPGSGPGSEMWQAFTPPPANLQAAYAALGAKWLGMDVGEQDGRYIGGYADQHYPLDAAPLQQMQYFDDHFTAMQNQLGSRVVSLQSLSFPHYMAQTGVYTILGCETAQALINSQVFYAFVRGAGKRYGLLYFGNVSIYGRFGFKTYSGTRTDTIPMPPTLKPRVKTAKGVKGQDAVRAYACENQGDGGPTCGTSLSLMTRLMLSHVFYNAAYVSFENGWFDGTAETPIGYLQAGIRSWVAKYGLPGNHIAQNALLLEHAVGFTAPRNLYTGSLYHTWGNLPYNAERGDYFVDNTLRLFFPNYQDSSYFHDETGFLSPTPFGDSLDVQLSDAPGYILGAYDTIIAASAFVSETSVLSSKLNAFLASGRRVIMHAASLASLGTVAGCWISEAGQWGSVGPWLQTCATIPGPSTITVSIGFPASSQPSSLNVTEPASFYACSLQCAAGAVVTPLASVDGKTIAWLIQPNADSNGQLIVLGSIGSQITSDPVNGNGIDESLTSPFPFLGHVTSLLTDQLNQRQLFTLPSNLSYVVSRNAASAVQVANGGGTLVNYTLLISNPTLSQQPLSISSQIGAIQKLTELPLGLNISQATVGYLPDGFQGTNLGNDTSVSIAGASTRVFLVQVLENDASSGAYNVTVNPMPVIPASSRPAGLAVNVHSLLSHESETMRDFIFSHPSLRDMFAFIVVDYTYLLDRTPAFLQSEAAWLRNRGFRIIIDLTSGLNLFPGMRLFNNSEPEFSNSLATIRTVLSNANLIGTQHVVVSLHRTPENNMDSNTAYTLMAETLAQLNTEASNLNITLHLRHTQKNGLGTAAATLTWLKQAGLSLPLFATTAALIMSGDDASVIGSIVAAAGPSSSLLFGVSGVGYDVVGSATTDTFPVTAATFGDKITSLAFLQGMCTQATCSVSPSASTARVFGTVNAIIVVDAYTGKAAAAGDSTYAAMQDAGIIAGEVQWIQQNA
jgi:hypothetical protein